MKTLLWVAIVVLLLVGGFFIFTDYFYQLKQNAPMHSSTVKVTPIEHASLMLDWNDVVIYADPVGSSSLFASLPKPQIIFITHEHGDHFSTSTLSFLVGPETILVAPQSVADKLPPEFKSNVIVMGNGDIETVDGFEVQAIPAYNIRPEALQYHPKGRDNGYVLQENGTRVYIAGDTEDTPEMRALKDIDIAFIPMNLPYTMSVQSAADAVLAFKPKLVYPYHYRNPDGLSDVSKFKSLVEAGSKDIQVTLANWYPK